MGKLEDALDRASSRDGRSKGGSGLGGAVSRGGVRLQAGHPGASAEDQVAGKENVPEESTRERVRGTPTSPRGTGSIGAAEG
jgi:hypothetical protein